MKTRIWMMILLMTAAVLITVPMGCKKDEPADIMSSLEKAAGDAADAAKDALCTKCGQIAGTPLCCREDAVKCEKCGMDKDSPGCCKVPEPSF